MQNESSAKSLGSRPGLSLCFGAPWHQSFSQVSKSMASFIAKKISLAVFHIANENANVLGFQACLPPLLIPFYVRYLSILPLAMRSKYIALLGGVVLTLTMRNRVFWVEPQRGNQNLSNTCSALSFHRLSVEG